MLKSFCDSLALNPGDSLLGKTAEWFSIRCNIQDQKYQQAVNSLHSILANPGSYADSIFALIDLSEVFSEMSDTSGLKLSVITRNPHVIPDSYKKFTTQRKEWIDLLLTPKETIESYKPLPVQSGANFKKSCSITSVHPNPSNDFVNIDYIVYLKGKISISLYTNTGKFIRGWDLGIIDQGDFFLNLNTKNFSEGIYFVILFFDNVIMDSGKIIVSH
jgi:hypothetical protein